MTARTTSTSAYAWRPDEQFFAANEVVGPALILQTSTVAGTVDGDTPVVRCAYVTDADAAYVAEAATIDESDPALSEVTVATKKIAQLVKISNEQYRQEQTASQLAQSVSRALIKKADSDYITSVSNPVGLDQLQQRIAALEVGEVVHVQAWELAPELVAMAGLRSGFDRSGPSCFRIEDDELIPDRVLPVYD